jgi:hypothetical protein
MGSFREWLAEIIRQDDPANGGYGLLADCPECQGWCSECQGFGTVPASAADIYDSRDDSGYVACDVCEGSGFAYNGKG